MLGLALLQIPSINVNEHDSAVIPLYSKISYPWNTHILSPRVCDNGKWEEKSIKYEGYHELSYLQPNPFTPSRDVVESYFPTDEPVEAYATTIRRKLTDIAGKIVSYGGCSHWK
jgi:hypothetical protein